MHVICKCDSRGICHGRAAEKAAEKEQKAEAKAQREQAKAAEKAAKAAVSTQRKLDNGGHAALFAYNCCSSWGHSSAQQANVCARQHAQHQATSCSLMAAMAAHNVD